MPDVDLKGILFRAYLPQFNDDTEEYTPVGPGDADINNGGVDLSCVMFRAWQRNDFEQDVGGFDPPSAEDFDGDGDTGDEDDVIGTITNTLSVTSTSTTTLISERTVESSGNSSTGTATIRITDSTSEAGSNPNSASPSVSEATAEAIINVGGTPSAGGLYGVGSYGSGKYDEGTSGDNQTIVEVII